MNQVQELRSHGSAGTVLRSPGLWILLAGLEAVFLINMSEFLYPGYSVSANYISDLGVGPMAPSVLFTVAVILFGLMMIAAAIVLRTRDKQSFLWLFLVLSGIGAIGVGVVNENSISLIHRASALLAFLFGDLAALYSYRLTRPPMSFIVGVLGLIGLSALALYGGGIYLGLGVGGMERMILYPAMLWTICFGAYLVANDSRTG